jgi:hypothetical protein
MVESGFAYPFFFTTLFADLRQTFVDAVKSAREDRRGIWAADATNTGVTFLGQDQLDQLPPIFPRLFRRLEEFGDRTGGIAGFPAFIENVGTKLMVLPGGHAIGFENVIEVDAVANTVRLTHKPEEFVFFN